MSSAEPSPFSLRPVDPILQALAARKAAMTSIRDRAAHLYTSGATGIQIASAISDATDALLVEMVQDRLAGLPPGERPLVEANAAVVAVGGTGRGELAPFSDVDLLFLYRPAAQRVFGEIVAQTVRDSWDIGLQVGHSLRTPGETIALARSDAQVATALVEARLLCGNAALFEGFRRRFQKKVVRRRRTAFIEDCIAARDKERRQHGSTVQQLEPDLKRSLGGLRDVHLIRWIGYARYGTSEIESLRLKGALNREDARALLSAYEFLLRLRIDLHLTQGKPQDVLTRDEQLRITRARGIEGTAGQRPVERFMQEYFRHSMAIADISQRFAVRHQTRSIGARFLRQLMTHRASGIFKVGHDTIDVFPWSRESVCRNVEQILRLYHAALLYGVRPAPELVERIRHAAAELDRNLSPEAAQTFLQILSGTGHLARVLRQLHETGVLEIVLPPMEHARCLLQFNQYHSYTVDEHTLQTIDAVVRFEQEESAVGSAYREIPHKTILHLALLLHDVGKGYDEDHSEVGKRIAWQMAERLRLPEHQRDTLVFLVHKHLLMPHLAFRRDVSDPAMLVEFARQVGSPDTLRMLYVLSAADLAGVGPGVWNDWKSELLTELFDNTMVILSGRHVHWNEEERLLRVRSEVLAALENGRPLSDEETEAIDRQLDTFAPHYLSGTPATRIAADIRTIRSLGDGGLVVAGENVPQNGTVEYRIIAHERIADGIFYKLAGVLTARRLEILSAQISTNLAGTVVDSFRVLDNDFAGEVPPEQIEQVAETIRCVVLGESTIEKLFRRHKRFGAATPNSVTWHLPVRVTIDNQSSDRCTIIDVFAHDRSGLLYTMTRAIYELGLSVMLAKVSTHLDQIVDVFYVTDREGQKIEDGYRLREIQTELIARIEAFERDGHQEFVR